MSIAIVTGSGGLIGAAAVKHFSTKMSKVVGIDNDMRATFFGAAASTVFAVEELTSLRNYEHHDVDIRSEGDVDAIFRKYGTDIDLVIHAAAQPSHDWAALDPRVDFSVNASGTLVLLEACRRFSPDAAFVFTSTNKVYGDMPNRLPLERHPTRFELSPDHEWFGYGIPESLSIDQSMHSLFGVSKAAADLMVQEYGRYFGMNTAVFRGGCLSGPGHAGAEMHGFLSYLVKCAALGTPYRVYGHEGRQVRDNIHSVDLVRAFDRFRRHPRSGVVYNIGGGWENTCSMLEAIELAEIATDRTLDWSYVDEARSGDHIWYVSDIRRFQQDYPGFEVTRSVSDIVREIADEGARRWKGPYGAEATE